MADIDCCDNAGGRVEMVINGVRYSARGSFTIRPTNFSREAGANTDGTIYTTTKSEVAEVEFTLSDKCGLRLDHLTKNCHVDATIKLIDMNKVYFFTRASVVGRPELDSESGEIRGLRLVAPFVRQR